MDREQALKLVETKWWEGKSPKEIVAFQLYEEKLCCPFEVFHSALEHALERPVFTHELAFVDNIRDEFEGKGPKPSLEDILNLIPADKKVIIVATEND